MIDKWIEQLMSGKFLSKKNLCSLCEIVKELLIEESNVQPINPPLVICGDIHGQFYDLMQLLSVTGLPPHNKFLFLGDYVDRGYNAVETLELLLCFKAKYPDKMLLLRGNHECRSICKVYGFYQECYLKYNSSLPWKWCTDVFDYLPVAATISDRIFCIHGGLSPSIKTLDELRVLDRIEEIPPEGALADLLWSDPENIETWGVSPRGAGYLFGYKVTQQFNRLNGFELICRAHQLVQEGFCYSFRDHTVLTIWSAPNYCYRCGNLASVLILNERMEREFHIFRENPEGQFVHSRSSSFYNNIENQNFA